jgi:hypothetical protein
MDLLNNAKMIGPFPWSGLAVGGKTLIFTEPVATVTFAGAADAVLTLSAIITAIKVAVAGIHVDSRAYAGGASGPDGVQKYLSLYKDGGLALAANGTANALFGLSVSDPTTVKPPVPGNNIKGITRVTPGEYEVVVGGTDADWNNPNPDGSSSSDGNYVVLP